MSSIIGAALVLIVSAIIAGAGMFLSYGSGIQDNDQFAFCWVVGILGGIVASLAYRELRDARVR